MNNEYSIIEMQLKNLIVRVGKLEMAVLGDQDLDIMPMNERLQKITAQIKEGQKCTRNYAIMIGMYNTLMMIIFIILLFLH